jgi:hypothetical protein
MIPILQAEGERSAKGGASIDPLQPPAAERVEPSRQVLLDRALARKSESL